MKELTGFLARLTSRKFLLVAGGMFIIGAGLLTDQQADKVVQLILAFVAAEGVGDAVQRFQHEKTTQAKAEMKTAAITYGTLDDDDDPKTIVPGDIAM